MSGGKGGDKTTTENTQSSLPEWARPYYEDMLGRGQQESQQPYQPYPGQRLSYFAPMEQESLARIGELGVSGTSPELNAAGQTAYRLTGGWDPGIAQPITSNYTPGRPPGFNYNAQSRESAYNANQLGPEGYYDAGSREMGFDPGTLNDPTQIQSYMDPYFQNVVDVEKREASRQGDMRNAQTGLAAAGQGSLGGYREALLRAENERNLMQQTGDIQTRGSQSAFQSAVQRMEQDRQARAQAEQFGQSQFGMNEQFKQRAAELQQQGFSANEAARQAQEELAQGQFGLSAQDRQYGAGLGLQGYMAYEQAKQAAAQMGLSAQEIEQAGRIAQNSGLLGIGSMNLGAAGQLGQFANQRQGMELERLNAMLQAGGMERGLMQQGLDTGYGDYMRQQAYPWQQLQNYAGLLTGSPVQPNQNQTATQPGASWLQQALGTGIAAYGMYNAYQGGWGD
jgi:hypothetical protein